MSISAEGLKEYIRRFELPERQSGLYGSEAELIMRRGAFVGAVIEQFSSLPRTMKHAREHVISMESKETAVASGTIFLASRLTGSKGRFTRTWHAPEGGLWGSMIYVNTLIPASRLLLPVAVGISCCEAIRQSGIESAVIRWINDVMIADRKVAGFLLEGFHGTVSKEEYTLTGFGININNTVFPEELKKTATSLKQQLGRDVDLVQFTYSFLAKLCWNLGLLQYEEECFLRDQKWSGPAGHHVLIDRWVELSDSIGRRVVFGFDVMEHPQYEATVTGISDSGGLILTLDDHSEIIEYSGEIRYLD